MQSSAKTVAQFLREQPEPIRAQLTELRKMIRAEAPNAVESMKHGMPFYSIDDAMLCAFNAQKQNLAFYAGRIPEALRRRMGKGLSAGKGCVRFRKLDPEKTEILRELLRVVLAEKIGCE